MVLLQDVFSNGYKHHMNTVPGNYWLCEPMFLSVLYQVPYFFGYKTEFFSFQNNPTDLDLSCKTDLDLWDCLGRVKLVL